MYDGNLLRTFLKFLFNFRISTNKRLFKAMLVKLGLIFQFLSLVISFNQPFLSEFLPVFVNLSLGLLFFPLNSAGLEAKIKKKF